MPKARGEAIALQPGIYCAGVVITYPDGDYVDQSIVVRVGDESCDSDMKQAAKKIKAHPF